MRTLHLLLLIILLTTFRGNSQNRIAISGFVEDRNTGERLIGAIVYDSISKTGIITSQFGYFSLSANSQMMELIVSYVGYKPHQQLIDKANIKSLYNISLESSDALPALLIQGTRNDYTHKNLSYFNIDPESIKSTPLLFGESDVMKSIQLLPGVDSGNEGTSNLYVRGGGADQNLVLLDGVPIYNSNHLFGFFSSFNSLAVKNIAVYKGFFPARYAGRTSSVIDISMKDGNNSKFQGDVELGLISSKVLLEGPLIKKKSSFILAMRRTYLDAFLKPIQSILGENKSSYFFHDLNAKINHRISEKDRLMISFYHGKDKYANSISEEIDLSGVNEISEENTGVNWSNNIGSIRYNRVLSPKLFGNLTLTYSTYAFRMFSESISFQPNDSNSNSEETINYNSNIQDAAIKFDFDFIPNPIHNIKIGTSITRHSFTPGVFNQKSFQSFDTTFGAKNYIGYEASLYLEDELNLSDRIKLNIGIHQSIFNIQTINFFAFQPRSSLEFKPNNNVVLGLSYSRMQQFMHLLANTGVGLPTDLWVPATQKAPPQISDQYSVDISLQKRIFDLGISIYYKHLNQLIMYQDGASLYNFSENWENKIEIGNGESYGVETQIILTLNKLNANLNYTLSKHNRTFENINQGRTFPFRFDRRHNIKFSSSYELKDNIQINANWIFGSGNPITIPNQEIGVLKNGLEGTFKKNQSGVISSGDIFEPDQNNTLLTYSNRNDFRMNSIHRLDVSIAFKKDKKRGIRTWVFGIYNLYNRSNPYFVRVESTNNFRGNNLQQYSLIPFLPYFSYGFKF
jgi:outer membrane receptor for ferrienterochelin and colicin